MFEFRYTCPKIDAILDELNDHLGDIEYKVKQQIKESKKNLEMIQNFKKLIKENIESLRELNSDMREAAEVQIEDLVSEVDDLNRKIEELKRDWIF